MKKMPVVLDLETKNTFRDVDKHKKLGVSVVGIYDYATSKCTTYLEDEIGNLFAVLENCSYLIGFNIRSFDLQVLQAYYPGDFTHFPVFDILDNVKEKIGKRISLNDIIYPTLGKKKTGHGFDAINYYKEGKIDELRQYCQSDVMLTRELFDYGVKNEKIYYMNELGKMTINVDWRRYIEKDSQRNETHLTLPF